jgi:Icc-related predicted phosphoesterase
MKIVAISDSHERHHFLKLPEGDVLVHSGDFTFRGEFNAVSQFAFWMSQQKFKHKIVIAGNHELTFADPQIRPIMVNLLTEAGCIYLEDNSVEIGGKVFYGSPWQPRFYDWAFNVDRGPQIAKKWAAIPENTNVLITHGPPHGILDDTIRDGSQGCKDLADRIFELKNLQAHIFGHLHRDGGKMVEEYGIKFVNASVCTDSYVPTNPIVTLEI